MKQLRSPSGGSGEGDVQEDHELISAVSNYT